MRLVDWFVQVGRHLAFMNCSMIAWAATLSLVSVVRLENRLTSSSLVCRPVIESCVLLWPLTEVARIFYGTQSEVLPSSLLRRLVMFWNFVTHRHAWESGSSLFSLLLWVDCEFSKFFKTDLQTLLFFLISRQRWALSLWRIWAISRFTWCCWWKWLYYCSSPTVEGLTESDLLQLSQGCCHCEFVADL